MLKLDINYVIESKLLVNFLHIPLNMITHFACDFFDFSCPLNGVNVCLIWFKLVICQIQIYVLRFGSHAVQEGYQYYQAKVKSCNH